MVTIDRQLNALAVGFAVLGVAVLPVFSAMGWIDQQVTALFWAFLDDPSLRHEPAVLDTLTQVRTTVVWGVVASVLVHVVVYLLAALALWRRTHYWSCFGAAALTALAIPVGTLVGLPTLLLLLKPEVKARFRKSATPPPVPSSAA